MTASSIVKTALACIDRVIVPTLRFAMGSFRPLGAEVISRTPGNGPLLANNQPKPELKSPAYGRIIGPVAHAWQAMLIAAAFARGRAFSADRLQPCFIRELFARQHQTK
jgi:hypothetical protein